MVEMGHGRIVVVCALCPTIVKLHIQLRSDGQICRQTKEKVSGLVRFLSRVADASTLDRKQRSEATLHIFPQDILDLGQLFTTE